WQYAYCIGDAPRDSYLYSNARIDRSASRRVMTMPKATRKQQLRRDLIEQRLLAFADQLGVFVGAVRAKGESSLDRIVLTTELGRIRDSAVDLLADMTREDTSP